VLGWEPKVKVVDGLRKTIEYFRKELSEPTERDTSGHGISGPYGNPINLPYLNDDKNKKS
jgi:UDP-glucuronate decarboxylase